MDWKITAVAITAVSAEALVVGRYFWRKHHGNKKFEWSAMTKFRARLSEESRQKADQTLQALRQQKPTSQP